MKPSKKISCIFTIVLLTFISCSKIDPILWHLNETSPNSTLQEHFFNSNRTTDAKEKALVGYFKRLDEKFKFVELTVGQIGYPRWDKAITIIIPESLNRTGSNSAELTYIPFVREEENFVNATLLVQTSPADTAFRYLGDWEYRFSKSGTLQDTVVTAERIAFTLMALDQQVFGHTKFKITDSMLFQRYFPDSFKNNQKYLELDDLAGSDNQARSLALQSVTVTFSAFCGTCISMYWQTVYHHNLNQIPTWVFPQSGGGGGGNTGGSAPSPCPGTGPLQLGQTATYGCGPGWQPSSGGGVVVTPTQDPCTIAKNAAKQIDSIYLKSKADSVLNSIPNLATETKEKGFPIYKQYSINRQVRTDTTITGYRSDTIHTGSESTINIIVNPRRLEALAATLHTHPPIGYAAHSADDIYSLLRYRSLYPQDAHHFAGSIVAAFNGSQYAITITNQTQAAAFLATQSQFLDGEKWNRNSVIGEAFFAATRHFKEVYESYPDNIHLAYEKAMAAVLNQFQTGVTLNKKDAAGNFKPIIVTTSPHPTKPNKKIYTQECL